MNAHHPIILYHYKYSPYAKRVAWYLALRGIPYEECLQPPILPRPDIARLGVSYRRIPILSIGRDIYLDTRLQLSKLESCPHLASVSAPLATTTSSSSGGTPESAVLTRLLDRWTNGTGLFLKAAALIPPTLPAVNDPAFRKDRADFFPRPAAPSSPQKAKQNALLTRAEALLEVREAFELLESSIFKDGREWVLGGDRPGLADIEAVWPLHWVVLGLPGALKDGDREFVTEAEFPRVWAWIKRFDAYARAAEARIPGGKPKKIEGEEVERKVVAARWNEDAVLGVDEADPVVRALSLKAGDAVMVWPTDTGSNHKDLGRLIGVAKEEVVWEATTASGKTVRVHAPRLGFRVQKADSVEPHKEKL